MLEFDLFEGNYFSSFAVEGFINSAVSALTEFALALVADVALLLLLLHLLVALNLLSLGFNFLVVGFGLDILRRVFLAFPQHALLVVIVFFPVRVVHVVHVYVEVVLLQVLVLVSHVDVQVLLLHC